MNQREKEFEAMHNHEGLNIFKLSYTDFEGKHYDHVSTSLSQEDFEKLLVKFNKESLKDEERISSYSHYSYILTRLLENNCMVFIYDTEYYLGDDCPIPNSTKWVKYENKLQELK